MKKIFCSLYFILGCLQAQKMYCIKDSVPIYSTKDLNSTIVGWLNKNDSVPSFIKTKHSGGITKEEEHLTEIFTWGQLKTFNNIEGWVVSSNFVKKLYVKPTFNVWNKDAYDNSDHAYQFGWSKDGKYYAYIVSGYIDGGVDGLTVRFYVLNASTNIIQKEITAYTSYDKPIDDAWRDYYFSMQSALNEYEIVQDTGGINLTPMPVKLSKTELVWVNFEISDTVTTVKASYKKEEAVLTTINQYIASIYCIGWHQCPYDKNKFIVYTTSNRGSSDYYVEAFSVDMKNFKK